MGDRTLAWFHCFSGIAGDMALGALLDAGAELAEVEAVVRRLPVQGWRMEAEPLLRGGVATTKAHVVTDGADHPHRTWRTIRSMLDDAELPARVHERATATFLALARAEAALHGTTPDEVHFHEVGAVDALVDVVGTCAALEVLGVDEVRSSAVVVGTGTIEAAHGSLPNPAPAVVRLLAEARAPTRGVATPVELTTPTGAALLAALATGFGPLPAMTVRATGFGAGRADRDGAVNATQVVLGTTADHHDATAGSGQPVVVLEATVDDATGETLAAAVPALLAAGAHDAWIAPVVMKKGRPGHLVTALTDVALAPEVARALREASGSLGVRASTWERWPATRRTDEVTVDGHPVRVKVSPARAKAEHDDVVAVAAALGRPVPEVAARAEAAWWADR